MTSLIFAVYLSQYIIPGPASGGGSGTVTSVGLALPSEFSVSGSPVTITGTLTGSWASQTQNKVLASPNGSSGAPSFRALVKADLPAVAVTTDQANTFSSGFRQTFAPNGTLAGLNIGENGGDPSTAVNGDMYYDSGTNKFRCYQNSAWTDCIQAAGGTVSSFSIVTANGFSGSVATATSTPALTITTTITGLLKGNGTAISAALAGTDYVVPSGNVATADAFSANPVDCLAGRFATGIAANGDLTCAIVDFSNLSCGTISVSLGGTGQSTFAQGFIRNDSGFSAAELSGDVETSASFVTAVRKVNGVSYTTNPSTSTVPIITAANTATYTSLPDCDDSGGNHLNYDVTTKTFSCGSSTSAPGSSPAGSGTELQYRVNSTTFGAVSGTSYDTTNKLITFAQGSVTGLTASTEAPNILFDGSARQFLTGALTSQREFKFTPPTISFVAASTLSNAATVYISGMPVQSTNATITNSHSLWIDGLPSASRTQTVRIGDNALSSPNSAGTLISSNLSAFTGDILRFQVGGTDEFKVGYNGTVTHAGNLNTSGNATISGTASVTGAISGSSTIAASSSITAGTRFRNAINTVTYSATPVFNLALGDQYITLTGNVTSSTLSNLVSGQAVRFIICQDSTGGRTFVWPTSVKGYSVVSAAANSCTSQAFESPDGTSLYATSDGVIGQ